MALRSRMTLAADARSMVSMSISLARKDRVGAADRSGIPKDGRRALTPDPLHGASEIRVAWFDAVYDAVMRGEDAPPP